MAELKAVRTASGLPAATAAPKGDGESRALRLTLGLYAAILVAKLGIYFATGVMVLLAEALHTLSDILISGFLLIALIYSRKRADKEHMFGHGRAQAVAGLVAATLFLSFTAYKLYEEAIPRLINPEAGSYGNLWLAVAVLGASVILTAIPFWGLVRAPKRGAAAKAQLLNLLNDELGLVAALMATILLMFGWALADPIASLIVATVIAVDGLYLFRENFSMLLGQAPEPGFRAGVERAALSVPGVVAVHGVLAESVGPGTVHAGIRVGVPVEMSVGQAARVAEKVKEKVHEQAGAGYCLVQVEPATAEERREESARSASSASARR